MSNITIAIVSDMETSPWGGSEQLWADSALSLRSLGHKVIICVRQWNEREHARIKELEEAGCIIVRRVNPASRRWWWQLGMKFKKRFFGANNTSEVDAVVRMRPDVALISSGLCWIRSELWRPFRQCKIPYQLLLQVANPAWWPSDSDGETQRLCHEGAKAVYFVSDANRKLVADQILFDHPRAKVVHNSLNLIRRECLPWPDTKTGLRLAFVGRLEPSGKGCDILLSVLGKEKWRRRKVSVSMFGGGSAAKSMRQLAERSGATNVKFFGHTASIHEIWKDHHALLLPSRYEGTPLVVGEAMLCGRMGIVTDVGGNSELIEDGVSGFCAEAPTERLLDQTLERAWSERHRWEEMGRAAFTRANSLIPQDPAKVFAETLLNAMKDTETNRQGQ
jgi:glycosyltransferase involved in cell wall biosynthesis